MAQTVRPDAESATAPADGARLARLSSYGVDTLGRDARLDRVVADAARITGAPVALLTVLTADGDTALATHGWNVTTLPAAWSLAARFLGDNDVVVIGDTAADPRFASHPLVTSAPFVRFVAAVPLVDDDVYLGGLFVVDRAPRELADGHADALRLLAREALAYLRARRERRDLETRVADADERFREFFERSDDLVVSIAADGRLLHANDATFTLLGAERSELQHQPFARVIEPASRDAFRTTLQSVLDSGEPHFLATTLVTGGGRRVDVEGTLQPKVVAGRGVLARVILRDVTERIAFEAELGRARDAALEAARLKTQFLTNVSHEIRTPMNGIVGMLDLLLATPLNEEQRDFAHQAQASAEQLLAIVNNILYVSNLEAGGLAAATVDFDLYRMLHRVLEVVKIAALGKDVEVTLTYDDRLPPVLRGNASKLRQVITNLTDNAIKFTEQGRIELRAALQTETDTHRVVRFEIADTGIGIGAEDRLLLFEKFSQIEATSTRRYQGVGLGLATARQLVETMGGLIDVDSVPGSGSTFWFTIPFAKAAAGRQPVPSSELDFRGKRVLLVVQEPTARKVIRHYLEVTWEMRVDVAESAREATAMLRFEASGDPYRVCLFDRGTDGDELAFARSVRGDAVLAATQLVHLASTTAQPNEEAMRSAGIAAYVRLPIAQAELFDALSIALAHEAIATPKAFAQPAPPIPSVTPKLPVPPELRESVRVLLAEDNFLNMKLTMSQLQRLGYHADSVANGREVLEALARHDYAIILMDCQMPIMDGYDATIEIRRRDGGRKRRIIAMTANALEGDREKCLAAGMDDYLAKPTKADELEVALARYFV